MIDSGTAKSQLSLLLNHFRSIGHDGRRRGISPMEARALYGIESLSRRICDLKEHGYNIVSEMRKAPNGKRYSRHYLASV